MGTDYEMYFKIWTVVALASFARNVTAVNGDCGQEELAECARPLQIFQTTPDLSIAIRKEELDKLCPDLSAGLKCIHSYTRRCMTLQQRNQFNKLYFGTNQVIRDLCKDGDYQKEFLRHAGCMRLVQPDYEICAKRYQRTMAAIHQTKGLDNVTLTDDQSVKVVCCSFTEYLSCAEKAARKICGEETALFTRQYLDKVSSTLVDTYCTHYHKGSGRCSEFESIGSKNQIHPLILIFTFIYSFFSSRCNINGFICVR